LIKYADDADLLVPENSKVDITDEFEHIKEWVDTNSMVINLAKTKEIVFHRPNPRNFVKPVAMDTIEQLTVAKILGVFVHGGFKCDNHVDFILSVCSQRVYLLKLLRDRGLQLPQLHIICQSLIVSRILYALPAWGGLLSAELKGRINAFLRRLYKYGFMHSLIDIEYLLTSSDRKLFKNMQKCEHCLNHLLPPRKNNDIALRPAGHEFLLPICNYELHRRSFVVRCLFNFLTE